MKPGFAACYPLREVYIGRCPARNRVFLGVELKFVPSVREFLTTAIKLECLAVMALFVIPRFDRGIQFCALFRGWKEV